MHVSKRWKQHSGPSWYDAYEPKQWPERHDLGGDPTITFLNQHNA